MKLKNHILLIALLLPAFSASAQYAEDALRFSQAEQGATARFKALGNAQTALGGDLSSLSGNPAGLGLFTKSDISLSLDFNNSNLTGSYFNQNSSAQLDKLGLTQLGAVWHSAVRKSRGSDLNTGWLSFNFGIGYNKTNNFNTTMSYAGVNSRSSFADFLADNGNIVPFSEGDLTDMAYQNYLIDYDDSNSVYNGYFPTVDINGQQSNVVYRTGSQSEVNFAFGANYSNKFYIGASLGLTSLTYNADREFIESGLTLRETDFPDYLTISNALRNYLDAPYSLSYHSSQITEGSGVNAKLGFIYRPTGNIRIGATIATPTWYSIDDSYAEGLNTRYTLGNNSPSNPAPNLDDAVYDYNYNLRTPYKINGGLALIFGQGLISGDVEYVDYASMHFSSNENSTTTSVNDDIRTNYQSAVNFRVGGEYKVNNLYLRAGYNTQGNPYKNSDFSSTAVSGGLGYRMNNFYIDATYVNSTRKFTDKPYTISEDYLYFQDTGSGDIASIKNNTNGVFLTIGTRF
ncbi:OmpP1/FadL family transporter [Rubrolithibacter danxiaensis]|uniref:OmpP1/FadL family transporter n=1 Tax=Rubrolithibacter danxiaensis TaxID=3390805 RepID=UPI003BF7F0DA